MLILQIIKGVYNLFIFNEKMNKNEGLCVALIDVFIRISTGDELFLIIKGFGRDHFFSW